MTQKIEIEYNGVILVETEPEDWLDFELGQASCDGCHFFELGGWKCESPSSNCIEHNIIWKRKE